MNQKRRRNRTDLPMSLNKLFNFSFKFWEAKRNPDRLLVVTFFCFLSLWMVVNYSRVSSCFLVVSTNHSWSQNRQEIVKNWREIKELMVSNLTDHGSQEFLRLIDLLEFLVLLICRSNWWFLCESASCGFV